MIMCQFIHARLKIEKIMCYRIILFKLPAAN